jgi:hypothetical protein
MQYRLKNFAWFLNSRNSFMQKEKLETFAELSSLFILEGKWWRIICTNFCSRRDKLKLSERK